MKLTHYRALASKEIGEMPWKGIPMHWKLRCKAPQIPLGTPLLLMDSEDLIQ